MTDFIQGTNGWWQEGELRIRFPKCHVRMLDDEMPNTTSCDFGVDTSYPPYLLIEIKDPYENSPCDEDSVQIKIAKKKEIKAYVEKMGTSDFIDHALVDAAINSKSYMEGQESETESCQFIALLGIRDLFDTETVKQLLTMVAERVRRRLYTQGEVSMGETVDIVDEVAWNKSYPFPLVRISTSEAA